MKISAPIPAESRPGTSTTPSIGPASPDTSISRNAPSSGDPSRALTAAKLPDAPTRDRASGDRSRLTWPAAQTASPPPRAIRGASGPSTAPTPSETSAASTTPGRCAAGGAPVDTSPSAGRCPPPPGSRRTTSPTRSPATPSSGTGHHDGVASKPSAFGSSVYVSDCSSETSARKPNAIAETGTPSTAAISSSPAYFRVRTAACGSSGTARGVAGGVVGMVSAPRRDDGRERGRPPAAGHGTPLAVGHREGARPPCFTPGYHAAADRAARRPGNTLSGAEGQPPGPGGPSAPEVPFAPSAGSRPAATASTSARWSSSLRSAYDSANVATARSKTSLPPR
ncbi:hypothetical protein SBADM41S_02337 [Streptomyces badius]